MKLLKKDIENLSESECISWQYEHLEKPNTLGNNFNAVITYNIKDKWIIIHLLRYGIGNNPQHVMLDGFWFIPDSEHIENYFHPYEELIQKIYDKLKDDLSKDYFTFCDFSESANELKRLIEQQKKSNESQVTD